MKELSIRDMRNALAHIDTLVNAAGELIITRHGTAIARILPIFGRQRRPDHRALHQLTKQLTLPSEKMIREDRDER